jgi:hypothetical protein
MGNHLQIQAAVADPDFVPGIHRTLKQLRLLEQQKHQASVLKYEETALKLNQLLKHCSAATAALTAAAIAAQLSCEVSSVWHFFPAVLSALLAVWLLWMRVRTRQPPPFFLPPEFVAPASQPEHAGPEDLCLPLLEKADPPAILGPLSLPLFCVLSQFHHAHEAAVATPNSQLLRCFAVQGPLPLPSGIPVYEMALTHAQRVAGLGKDPTFSAVFVPRFNVPQVPH